MIGGRGRWGFSSLSDGSGGDLAVGDEPGGRTLDLDEEEVAWPIWVSPTLVEVIGGVAMEVQWRSHRDSVGPFGKITLARSKFVHRNYTSQYRTSFF